MSITYGMVSVIEIHTLLFGLPTLGTGTKFSTKYRVALHLPTKLLAYAITITSTTLMSLSAITIIQSINALTYLLSLAFMSSPFRYK